jgi:hypothetical protein
MFSWFRRNKAATDNADWVVILSTDNVSEAHIVAGRLQYEGIAAWVHQQPGVSGLGITVGVLGEVRVLVNADDYEVATAILDQELPPLLDEDNDDIRYIFPTDTDKGEDFE